MSTTAKFEDDSEFEGASGSVRNDGTETKYVIVSHVDGDPHKIQVYVEKGHEMCRCMCLH